jgi:hypothetical protein
MLGCFPGWPLGRGSLQLARLRRPSQHGLSSALTNAKRYGNSHIDSRPHYHEAPRHVRSEQVPLNFLSLPTDKSVGENLLAAHGPDGRPQ